MLDLLNLPGVKPVDLVASARGITVIAEVSEVEIPHCPECKIRL